MELTFEWDDNRASLVRIPDSPACTNEENVEQSQLVIDVYEGTTLERDTARYRMAECAYEHRTWYQPVVEVPGAAMPVWMHNADKTTYQDVRNGIRQLNAVSTLKERDKLLERSNEAQRAARFLDYVRRVTACEAYNRSALRPLMMARAVLAELNPEGDAERIRALCGLLREWYGVHHPADSPSDRMHQTRVASRSLDWLTPDWRSLWARP